MKQKKLWKVPSKSPVDLDPEVRSRGRKEGQRLKFRILSGNEERQTFESPMVSLDIAQRLQIEKDSSEVWDAFLKLRKVKSLSLGPKKEVLESLKAGFLVKN